ncbi:variable surface protein [Plasmodium gonderi]|uniref:Variable surface protein n=1 Tax=Plasmodium gonderi TaxID=77519 RepID=A0A1Y1JNN7_PLAGO|nr:variable surface protein [Plasmodium gonderi]GAW82013.1 variable surface protein [Plasmodium gonderi]
MKEYNEKCDERYAKKKLCHTYFYKEFNSYPSVLHIKHKDYLERIRKFHDPILKYVALYLYHNYVIAKEYFVENSNNNNAACGVLNRWLDQQKNLYTNFRMCYYNTRWWDIHIEPLWEELERYYPGNTCKRKYSYYSQGATHNEPNAKDDRLYQQMPEEFVCYNENVDTQSQQENDNTSIKENCAKLSILFDLCEKHYLFNQNSQTSANPDNIYCKNGPPYENIYYTSMLKAEKLCFCVSLLNKIALPIIVTVLGTIFLAFFFNEFTPIGSIFRNSSKNKIRLREQFNEEAEYKVYKTYKNNNQNRDTEKNIIYYQSMNV